MGDVDMAIEFSSRFTVRPAVMARMVLITPTLILMAPFWVYHWFVVGLAISWCFPLDIVNESGFRDHGQWTVRVVMVLSSVITLGIPYGIYALWVRSKWIKVTIDDVIVDRGWFGINSRRVTVAPLKNIRAIPVDQMLGFGTVEFERVDGMFLGSIVTTRGYYESCKLINHYADEAREKARQAKIPSSRPKN